MLECLPGHFHPQNRFGFPAGDPSRGFAVWVDCVDDLVMALALEPTGRNRNTTENVNLEHLYALPEGGKVDAGSGTDRALMSNELVPARSAVEELYFPRDVGAHCGLVNALGSLRTLPWAHADNQRTFRDSYSVVQVDDLANPWAFFSVVEARNEQIATRIAADIPGTLAKNPRLHSNQCRALYETHMVATKGAQQVDAKVDALTMVLLRDEFLNIAWTGESRVVLGRLAAKPVPPKSAPEPAVPAVVQGSLRLASRQRPGRKQPEGYIASRQMKQWIEFDGPPPILRAVDLTAPGDGVCGGDSAGGGPQPSPLAADKPAVRRMKLKPDDVCVIIATQGIWKCLSPEEVVTIVGQNMNRMASDAAQAVISEVRRRETPNGPDDNSEELSVIVVYLAGERYVKDFDFARANHLGGDCFVSEGLMPAKEPSGIEACFCRGRSSQLYLDMQGMSSLHR